MGLNGAATHFFHPPPAHQLPSSPYVGRSRTPLGPSTREYERVRETLGPPLTNSHYYRTLGDPGRPSDRVREEYERVRESTRGVPTTLADPHFYRTIQDPDGSGPSTRRVREEYGIRGWLLGLRWPTRGAWWPLFRERAACRSLFTVTSWR